jgi:hypothetical protein
MGESAGEGEWRGQVMTRGTRTPPRSNLRLTDLKQREPEGGCLINAKVPAHVADAITEIAAHVGTTKTDVVVALLNTGLDVMKRLRRGR